MLLSDRDLTAAIGRGALQVNPFDPALVQPASLDVRLGHDFRVFNLRLHSHIDPADAQPGLTDLVTASPDVPLVLQPGQFALASTMETIALGDDVAARFEGKSTLGRAGLLTHVTAGFIDPGFRGQITLELSNLAPLPILLRPGTPIGQLCVMSLTSPAARPYGSPGLGSRYQGQQGPTPARAL